MQIHIKFNTRQLRRQTTFNSVSCGARKLVVVAEISEDMKIADVERRLAGSYAQFPADEVSTIVQSARQKFAESPIRDFVPLFVERNARARLDKLGSLVLNGAARVR